MTDPVRAGDLDGCLRRIDDLVSTRSWSDLEAHRLACLAAFERGHQLWPAAHAAAYRLALDAPAEFAVPAVIAASEQRFFGLGPLAEVIASRLEWADLEPHLPPGPLRSTIAEERIIRGEDLSDTAIDRALYGTSAKIASWEPRYAVATYHHDRAEFGDPPLHQRSDLTWESVELGDHARARLDDDDVTHALHQLTAAWTEQSNGRCETAAVDGSALDAITSLGVRTCTVAAISITDAAAAMAWAAANGGAHGRRRGIAAGRFDAWWAVAAAANLTDDWPVSADRLGDEASALNWFAWHPGHVTLGWELHLAVEDPDDGLAWVIAAVDTD